MELKIIAIYKYVLAAYPVNFVEQRVEVILIAGNENQHEDQVKVASGAGMCLLARAHPSAYHSPDTEAGKRDA